jgi:GWxTD domain-containing protein
MRRSLPLVAALLAPALAAGVALLWAAPRKDSLRMWLDGPVHYIVDTSEIKEFKSLKTDADRAAFIERFWRRRDPTPATLVNEFRQLFWNRVQEANEKFLDSSKRGWQTDRGKIYILYGPPDEVKEDPNADAGTGGATDASGLIRWVYLKPGGRKDVAPVVYVPFVRDVTGEYRVSYDPQLASPFFNWSEVEDNRTVGLGNFLHSIQPGSDPLSVMLDLGKLQEVPPQESILLDSVETVETFSFLPLPVVIHRFQPGPSGMLAIVTAAIPGPPGSEPPSLLARFAHKGSQAGAHILGEGSFRIDGDGEDRVAQARVALDAGAWEFTVLSVEPGTGVSRVDRGHIEPLPPGPALHLSDIVLARAMEPLQYAAQASYDAPYIIGGFKVTPTAGTTVKRGDPVKVFFEIAGGVPPYHLAYQLEGQERDGRFVALGKPLENDGSARGQGFELPTKASWPAGSYRLNVTVSDAAAATISGLAPFTLVLGSAP